MLNQNLIKPLIASAQYNIEKIAQHTAEHSHHAAEHVAQHGHHGEFDLVAYILHSNIINILFVAWFILWIFRKFDIISKIKEKRDTVAQIIAASEEEKSMAEDELQDAKSHVKNLDKEVRSVLLEAKNSAEAMYEKIKSDTKKRADEIQSSLERMSDAEKKSASEELSQKLTEEAFGVAEKHIKNSLTDEMHNKHINDFIDSLDEKKVK